VSQGKREAGPGAASSCVSKVRGIGLPPGSITKPTPPPPRPASRQALPRVDAWGVPWPRRRKWWCWSSFTCCSGRSIVVEEVGWPFARRPAPGFGGTRPKKTCPVLLSVSGCVQEVVRGVRAAPAVAVLLFSSELLAYFFGWKTNGRGNSTLAQCSTRRERPKGGIKCVVLRGRGRRSVA